MRFAVALVGLLGSTAIAVAQPGTPLPDPTPLPIAEPITPATTVMPPADVAPTIDRRDDPGWQLYHDAFTALARGDRAGARKVVAMLLRDHPSHPAAELVARSTSFGTGVTSRAASVPEERPTSGARAELALFETVHGLVLGIELCILVECETGEAYFGLALLGAAGGAAASLGAVDHVTSGQRSLLVSGTSWGTVDAALLTFIVDPDKARSAVLAIMTGQLGGFAIGATLTSQGLTAGQTALANSGGIWGGVLTGLTLGAFSALEDDNDFALAELVAINGGLAAGAYLAYLNPGMSRAQTLVIDSGGIAGAVGGAGAAVLISGDTDERVAMGAAALGAAIGLGTAAYLTRHWGDGDDDTSLQSYVVPVERARGGIGGAIAGVSFAW